MWSVMATLSSISDSDLLGRMPGLVCAERTATAEVIEHLMEIDRRRLYLDQACSSLHRYCIERLDYSEDEAFKRMRVARLAAKLPGVLEELRSGAIHLTGLFLLSVHLTEQNAEALLSEARGKSRREIEKLLARWFPRPDAESRIEPVMEPSAGQTPLFDRGLGTGSGLCLAATDPGTGPRPLGRGDVKGTPLRARTWPGIGRSGYRLAPGVLVTHRLGPQSSQRGRGAVRRISLEERRRHRRA
jgi:hypothetical protein